MAEDRAARSDSLLGLHIVRVRGGEGVERRRLGIGAHQRRIRREVDARSGAHCTFAGPGRCRPSSPRRRTGSGRRAARRAPPARRSLREPSGGTNRRARPCRWPSASSRFSTRRLLSGWMSAAMVSASASTWARSPVSSGSSAGSGNRASSQDDDREALGEPQPVRFQHRHEALRVAGAIGLVLLLALEQVDRHALDNPRP